MFYTQEDERDNIEIAWEPSWIPNAVDPMYLPSSEGRVRVSFYMLWISSSFELQCETLMLTILFRWLQDFFPKQTLTVDGKIGYIGDKVQRCDTLITTK